MRNVKILLAVVAVMAMVVPAFGANTYWDGSSDNDWHNGDNWNTGLVPTGADRAYIVNSGTAVVTGYAPTSRLYIAHYNGGAGTVQMTGGEVTFSDGCYIGYESNNGVFEISGGVIDQGAGSTWKGKVLVGKGTESRVGTFRVIGDSASIDIGMLSLLAFSKLDIVLSSTGTVSEIGVYRDATLKGTLLLDDSACTPAEGRIDILTATTSLDITGLTLDAGGDPNWSIGQDGNTLYVNYVPEPATLALLSIGGISVLIRRKRR